MEKYLLDYFKNHYKNIPAKDLEAFIKEALALDNGYMAEVGFFEDEDQEDLIYDEEDAYNYILGGLYKDSKLNAIKPYILENMVDDYIECKYDYLLSIGLVD